MQREYPEKLKFKTIDFRMHHPSYRIERYPLSFWIVCCAIHGPFVGLVGVLMAEKLNMPERGCLSDSLNAAMLHELDTSGCKRNDRPMRLRGMDQTLQFRVHVCVGA